MWLFLAAISLPWLALTGAGLLWLRALLPRDARESMILPELLGAAGVAGLLLHHTAALVLPLGATAALTVALALAGWIGFFLDRRRASAPATFVTPGVRGILFFALLALWALKTVSDPLAAWDARSIWFLQARMIYFAGGVPAVTRWNDPGLFYAHMDYPKLLPALAAQLAHRAGLWNEHLPKLALLQLWIPATLLLLALTRKTWAFVFLFIGLVVNPGNHVWDGYMDGFLSIYCAIALLALARGRPVVAIVSLALVPNLKNEGTLFVAVVFALQALMLAFRTLRGPHRKLPLSWKEVRGTLPWIALLFLPVVLWGRIKAGADLTNDLHLGLQSLPVIRRRLFEEQGLPHILRMLWGMGGVKAAFLLLCTAVLFEGIRSRGVARAGWAAFGAGLLYLAGMILIYLATPHDLGWHLGSSVDRTMLIVVAALTVAAFLFLKDPDEGGVPAGNSGPGRTP